MTENKRFEFREVNHNAIIPKVYDTEKQQYANLFKCIHWLNDLHEENEQLKEDYNYLEKRFKEEEWHYDHIDEDRDAWRHKCQELEKENEKSKQKIKSIKEILNEDIGYIELLRKIEEALK